MAKKKILIIDDEADILMLLKVRLTEEGYAVETAANGSEGLESARSSKPDLIIMDLLMPGLSGYQLLSQIRGLGGVFHHLPIIIISAKPKMRDLFHTADIHSFLPKPFTPEELLVKIKSALHLHPPVKVFSAENQEPSGGQQIILAGVDDYITQKLKRFLEMMNYQVFYALDEKEILDQAQIRDPDLILCQYWEEPAKFNAEDLYEKLQANSLTAKIPFLVFCSESLGLDAMKFLKQDSILTFAESRDLIYKLDEYLKSRKHQKR